VCLKELDRAARFFRKCNWRAYSFRPKYRKRRAFEAHRRSPRSERSRPIITIDQEGGRVSRLRLIGNEPPNAQQLRDKAMSI
jgi:hypothetical protein